MTGDSVDGVLLLAGEEVTNYFHGHATVSGIRPGEWFDFRHSPFGLPLLTGGGRIQDLIRTVREAGGYLPAAHPAWRECLSRAMEPAHGTIITTGHFPPADQVAGQPLTGAL